MSVYIVTGKLGNGKTLVTVGKILDALKENRPVATNLDLNAERMLKPNNKTSRIIRVPDKPSIDDLNLLGAAYDGLYDESKFGVLVLDECGTWFNSRNWQDKSRKAVNDWFLHARKFRWHVFLIIQDLSLLDSQAREALAEHTVFCRRLDNIRIPVIGAFVAALTGYRLTLPRIHRAKVVYGVDPRGLVSDVWVYRGNDMFSFYQTDQIFLADYPHGPHSILPPWYTKGRYMVPRNWGFYMRMTKIYWKRFKSPIALGLGCLLGVSMAAASVLGYSQTKYQAQLTELQALADSLAKPGLAVEDSTYNRLAGLDRSQIVKYSVLGSEKSVSIAITDSDGISNEFDIKQLRRLGVKVDSFGSCDVQLIYQGKIYYPSCISVAGDL